MKGLFWEVRGLANAPSRLALKRLYNPDICLTAEPWMNFYSFPRNWLSRIAFKLFALNKRENLLPNLWRLCANDINPSIVAIEDQFVYFTIAENGKTFGIIVVYASTYYLRRRQLWNKLDSLQNRHSLMFLLWIQHHFWGLGHRGLHSATKHVECKKLVSNSWNVRIVGCHV